MSNPSKRTRRAVGKYNMPREYIARSQSGAVIAKADTQPGLAELLECSRKTVYNVSKGNCPHVNHPKHRIVYISRVWKTDAEPGTEDLKQQSPRPRPAHPCANCVWGRMVNCSTVCCGFQRCVRGVIG